MDLDVEALKSMDEIAPVVVEEKEEETEREKGQLLNPEEMEALRSEVCMNLK